MHAMQHHSSRISMMLDSDAVTQQQLWTKDGLQSYSLQQNRQTMQTMQSQEDVEMQGLISICGGAPSWVCVPLHDDSLDLGHTAMITCCHD